MVKMKFQLLTMLLLLSIFCIGGVAGAFSYAAGKAVIENPSMKMVSNTEYRFSEPGQIIARLVDYQGNPVVVTNCTATILYPDKTFHTNAALMSSSVNISGDHFYSFTTPAGPEGTYEYQATCYYGPGGIKSMSVTNSFHLSSALGSIMANQSSQEAQLVSIQGNLTAVQSSVNQVSLEVASVNATLGSQISSLSNQLNLNVTMLYDQANSNLATVQSQLNANITSVLNSMTLLNVNLTPVLTAVSDLNAAMAANFTYTNGLISTLSNDMVSNFSVVTGNQATIISNQATAYLALQEINTTTQNTYTYLTVSLATNVNSILADLGVINATVNRIEVVANNINSTTTQILTNQQEQVIMSTFSG